MRKVEGIEELRQAILNEARKRAEEIIQRAEQQAKEIIEKAEERKKLIIEEGKKRIELELGVEAKIAEARTKARMMILESKTKIFEDIKRRALEVVSSVDAEIRARSFKNIAEEILNELLRMGVQCDIEAVISERDAHLKDELIRLFNERGLRMKSVSISKSLSGGVIVSCGGITLDGSYESRLKLAERIILIELNKRLSEVA